MDGFKMYADNFLTVTHTEEVYRYYWPATFLTKQHQQQKLKHLNNFLCVQHLYRPLAFVRRRPPRARSSSSSIRVAGMICLFICSHTRTETTLLALRETGSIDAGSVKETPKFNQTTTTDKKKDAWSRKDVARGVHTGFLCGCPKNVCVCCTRWTESY